MKITREILRDRHRLSKRQIDDVLGEKKVSERKDERLLGMQRIGIFLDVAKALNKENIWFLNLKGPLLSQRIYRDPTYRSFRDFDILVKPKKVNQTLQILKENGYKFGEFKWPQSKRKQEIALHFLNQLEMNHEESGTMLEVHWKLFSARITNENTLDKLIEDHVESVEFGGQELDWFTLEFELFYLIVHGGIHAWFRLKWLLDIHEILKRKRTNWRTFNSIVSQCRAQKLVDICNMMLKEYFPDGPKIPFAGTQSLELGQIAIEQSKRPDDDPRNTRANTLKLLRYRMLLFPYLPYKLDVSKVMTFYKGDLKIKWLPPFRFVYYLFRPVGYFLRGIGFLK